VKRFVVPVWLALLAACPKSGDKPKPVDPAGSGSGSQQVVAPPPTEDAAVPEPALPPAPPPPAVPQSLPSLTLDARITGEAIAFGELLFFDPRLSADGKRSCASCHDPARGYSGGIEPAADGKPNARRAPSLYNLAWAKSFGWDGRATKIEELLVAHLKGQLDALEAITPRVSAVPTYGLHIARVGGSAPDAIVNSLIAYVLTRYEGDTPWDSLERTERISSRAPTGSGSANAGNPIALGYKLFMGKAQCGQCHPPPLYTDNSFHRVIKDATGDKGRGLVDPAKAGAFRTPTLRGAMTRGAYFHDASKTSVNDVLAYYQSPDAAAIDKTFGKIKLTPDEARFLGMFLNMLSNNRPPYQKPVLP